MTITGLDLGAWISIYFGLGFIRADKARKKSGRPFSIYGYSLLLVGCAIFGLELMRRFH